MFAVLGFVDSAMLLTLVDLLSTSQLTQDRVKCEHTSANILPLNL